LKCARRKGGGYFTDGRRGNGKRLRKVVKTLGEGGGGQGGDGGGKEKEGRHKRGQGKMWVGPGGRKDMRGILKKICSREGLGREEEEKTKT